MCVCVLRISPYSVQMRKNTGQNNSEYGHFLHSGCATCMRAALICGPLLIRGNSVHKRPKLFNGNLALIISCPRKKLV